MHISEGVLSAPVLVTGAALTAVGVAVGLKKMDYEKIPQVAVLTSAWY
jgi:cobalt/nickel transport system permease protein